MNTPPICNAAEMARVWEAYGGETAWSIAARRFGELGGLAQYWCGMPQSASAIPLTFALFAPNGDPLPCKYRLRDIRNAIKFLNGDAT